MPSYSTPGRMKTTQRPTKSASGETWEHACLIAESHLDDGTEDGKIALNGVVLNSKSLERLIQAMQLAEDYTRQGAWVIRYERWIQNHQRICVLQVSRGRKNARRLRSILPVVPPGCVHPLSLLRPSNLGVCCAVG